MTPQEARQLAAKAANTWPGTWTNESSQTLADHLEPAAYEIAYDALRKLAELNPVQQRPHGWRPSDMEIAHMIRELTPKPVVCAHCRNTGWVLVDGANTVTECLHPPAPDERPVDPRPLIAATKARLHA